jgi:hypothetical protein
VKIRLLADENTSHRVVSACVRIAAEFPIISMTKA